MKLFKNFTWKNYAWLGIGLACIVAVLIFFPIDRNLYGTDMHFNDFSAIVGVDDEKGYLDTENWTEGMKKAWADKTYEYDPETQQQKETGSKEYATGAEYLAAHSYAAVSDIGAYISTGNMDTIKLDFGK